MALSVGVAPTKINLAVVRLPATPCQIACLIAAAADRDDLNVVRRWHRSPVNGVWRFPPHHFKQCKTDATALKLVGNGVVAR